MSETRTIQDLQLMQAAPLTAKIRMTKRRIRDWVNEYGEDGVYVSFSGGKDSTCLLTMAREEFPGIKAVFSDTGLEYPEIREFVKNWDNVEWLKPKKTFKQVIEEYGYPFISKEVSESVSGARKFLKATGSKVEAHYRCEYEKLTGTGRFSKPGKSTFSCKRYRFFLDAPFEISPKCCQNMKKSPIHDFQKKTEWKHGITAMMASESKLRMNNWMRNGCNGFNMKNPISNPMSFWTEQDVLKYIKENSIPICSVYGEIVESDELPGQMTWADYAGFDIGEKILTTTGAKRTGCMFCGFGCHLEKPGEGRFERMKKTHPKQYDYIMRPLEKGGLGYKEVIDWINEHGGLDIRY